MNDAAFVAMDFDAAGRIDLATQFINSYVEWTGDWEGLQVLPLYRCMRAYVRAMVHSLASDEPELIFQEKEQARRSAERYYRLAWQYTLPDKGQLILMSGTSGAGKSTIASVLAQKTGAIHIRSDAVRKHFSNVPLDERASQNMYSHAMNVKTYARLLELGVLLGQQGFKVILDAKYARRDFRKQAFACAREAGLAIRMIQCTAPEEMLRARLKARQNDVSDARADLLSEQLSAFEPLDEEEQSQLTVVDTSQAVDWSGLLNRPPY